MKLRNKLISMIMAIALMINVMPVIAGAATGTPSVTGAPGSQVTVTFNYSAIMGVNGTVTFSDPSIISSVTGFASNMSGMYLAANGKAIFNSMTGTPTDTVFTLTITLAANAPSGSTCKVTFEHETTANGYDFSDISYDYATITVQKPIDYTELLAQINRAGALSESDWTSDSWNAMKDMLILAKGAQTSKDQSAVDKAAQNLSYAIDSLVKATPKTDYTALNAQISRASSLKESDYTSASWLAMQTALKNAKNALNSTDQTTVNNAANALKTAIDSLVKAQAPAGVDYTALNSQISRAEALKESDYTAGSWAAMTAALKAAREARSSNSQTTVDSATGKLRTAIDSLVKASTDPKEVDYTYLQTLIAQAEELKKEDYTEDSWDELESALTAAKAALDSKSQEDVNLAASVLADAIESLTRINGIDYTTLKALIEAGAALNAKDYTSESWSVFIAAFEDAKTALDSDDQAVVDSKAADLKSAMDALVKINYDALRDALAQVENFKTENESITDLWDQLLGLIEKAEGLLEGGTQEEIDACTSEILELLEKISKALGDTGDVGSDGLIDPSEKYCNITMHKVWMILFFISLGVNLVGIGLLVFKIIMKKKKEGDDVPLVDYDIEEDGVVIDADVDNADVE